MTIREELAATIGERAASKLLRTFARRVVRFPSLRPDILQLRNQRVVDALSCDCGCRSHHSNKAVARRFGISERQVIKIGKAPAGPDVITKVPPA